VINFSQNRLWMLIAAIIIVLIVAIFGGYWVWKGSRETVSTEKTAPEKPLPRMANLPPKKTKAKPPEPSYPPDAPVLEQVREALRGGIDPAGAVTLAKSLPDRPERADAAFLLFEYAAEGGDPEAALSVGRYYDPADDGPSGTIRKNPATAYVWYLTARDGGQGEAENHLSRLRKWLEQEALKGSSEAWELLDRWH
jgi:TPR repeat protein